MALEPGSFASVNDPIMLSVRTRSGKRFQTRVYDPFSSVALGSSNGVDKSIYEEVQTRAGRRFAVRPYDPFSPVLGASIFDPIAPLTSSFAPESILTPMKITAGFTPTLPSVIATPAPASSTVWNPITSLLSLWDQRPQVLKDIRLSVNPNQAMAALQNVVKPSQVSGAVTMLRSWGINPSYQGVPVTGPMAGAGYQVAGMNIGQYLPWIIGGGAVLLLLPMLMKK
jgi:hypothetical protein